MNHSKSDEIMAHALDMNNRYHQPTDQIDARIEFDQILSDLGTGLLQNWLLDLVANKTITCLHYLHFCEKYAEMTQYVQRSDRHHKVTESAAHETAISRVIPEQVLDEVRQFVEERCVLEKHAVEKGRKLRNAYEEWANQRNVSETNLISVKKFSNALQQIGYAKFKSSSQMYCGLRVKKQ
jgi:regulator of sigma D